MQKIKNKQPRAGKRLIHGAVFGGDNRARTCDPLRVEQVLSQLSYASPISGISQDVPSKIEQILLYKIFGQSQGVRRAFLEFYDVSFEEIGRNRDCTLPNMEPAMPFGRLQFALLPAQRGVGSRTYPASTHRESAGCRRREDGDGMAERSVQTTRWCGIGQHALQTAGGYLWHFHYECIRDTH